VRVFFVFLSRRAQVDVNVDQAWRHDAIGGIEYSNAARLDVPTNSFDDAVANQDMRDFIQILRRIEYSTVLIKRFIVC
jgi:hypothetical protein